MKKGYNLIQVIIIIIVTAIISGVTVGVMYDKSNSNNNGTNYSELLKDDNIKEFLDIYSSLDTDYYEDFDKEEMMDKVIKTMTDYLGDKYTTYLDQTATSQLEEQLNGTYEGVGIIISDKTIVSVVADSSAAKAGLAPGDIIYSIDGNVVDEMTNDEISNFIKKATDSIELVIKRDNELKTFNLEISELSVPNSEYSIIDNTTIGYLKISLFSSNIASEVDSALTYLKKQNITGLIVDLRDNSGGYLEQAYKTASLFTKKGQIIYYLENTDNDNTYKDKDNNSFDKKIVVLINNQTASAAEILTGALTESYGAESVGKTTYGKGKVQHTYKTESGGLVKYTSSIWLTPNGNCIDGVGISPTYNIDNEYSYDEDNNVTGIIDNQKQKAIELLSN